MPRFLIRKRTWIFAACVLALIFSFFFIPSLLLSAKNISYRILLFPSRLFSAAGEYFSSKKDLMEENARLRREMGELSLKISALKELKSENERLRNLLRFKKRFEFETVSAEVIARSPGGWIESFIIDKGADEGITRNAAVCSAEGLLGKVVDTQKNTSTVMLVTHINFKAGAVVEGTRINGIVVGSGRSTLTMLYIPLGAEIPEGKAVVTSNLSRIFPEGIPIGRVLSVGKSVDGLYKYAVIKPFTSPFNQKEVLCIKQ